MSLRDIITLICLYFINERSNREALSYWRYLERHSLAEIRLRGYTSVPSVVITRKYKWLPVIKFDQSQEDYVICKIGTHTNRNILLKSKYSSLYSSEEKISHNRIIYL